jgi:thiol-disulfide isomerase/thioredoxin
MSRTPRLLFALTLLGWTGCETAPAAAPPLTPQLESPPEPNAALRSAVAPSVFRSPSGVDPSLPVVGDPLGLLSKPPRAGRGAKASPGRLDPAALMADPSAKAPSAVVANQADSTQQRKAGAGDEERARQSKSGKVRIQEKSAQEVVRRASQGGARVHVLLLYASYCKACRSEMPAFVQLVRSYKSRGVAFTAASVDGDPEAFAAYAAALEGTTEPYWIRSDGSTRAELTRAGIQLPNNTFSIPLFAVFAGQRRLVAQGHSLDSLPGTLDALL